MLIPDFAQQTLTDEIIAKLKHSEFKFFLTGSRYFGTHKKDSDWDFFVQDDYPATNSRVRLYLESNGFHVDSQGYQGMLITEVWKHEPAKIHVQIVRDADLKNQAQRGLLRHVRSLFARDDRELHRQLWDLAIFVAANSGLPPRPQAGGPIAIIQRSR